MRFFTPAATLSAFLLFLAQPVAGKLLLPHFGGSAGVWATCLVFFQLLLLLGYLYSHWSVERLSFKKQVWVHLCLLAVSLLLLRFTAAGWADSAAGGDPTVRVLIRLAALLGLPFFVLSTSTPLLQSWYARLAGGELPYRLYAYSNAGSLTALLSYPVLIEPNFSLHNQTLGWSYGYMLYALWCAALALAGLRRNGAGSGGEALSEAEARPGLRLRLMWLALAGCASALLLAVTNLLTQDVAPVPFLWVAPLALYLISFILSFAHPPRYHRRLFGWLITPALFMLTLAWFISRAGRNLELIVGALCGGLFVCCMYCHGELSCLKPAPRFLTSFYLMVSAGGVLGSAFVALGAPHFFSDYFEYPLALGGCALLVWLLSQRRRQDMLRLALTLALVAYAAGEVYAPLARARFASRNFYGALKVVDEGRGDEAARIMFHGNISHGSQWLAPGRRRLATTYYGPESGGALAIENVAAGSRRIGVVGLGPGTLAAYGRRGDFFKFYELNPLVIRLARTQFTYLSDCPAKIELVEGDARLSLAAEPPQQFDVLLIDAFAGDSIPVHLLTREAFEIYFRHVKPQGMLAFHVSNRFLDLREVVAGQAAALGRQALAVTSPGRKETRTHEATWILVSADRNLLNLPVFRGAGQPVAVSNRRRLWSDDYSNLFQAIK